MCTKCVCADLMRTRIAACIPSPLSLPSFWKDDALFELKLKKAA